MPISAIRSTVYIIHFSIVFLSCPISHSSWSYVGYHFKYDSVHSKCFAFHPFLMLSPHTHLIFITRRLICSRVMLKHVLNNLTSLGVFAPSDHSFFGYRIRTWYMTFLSVLSIISLYCTLAKLDYPDISRFCYVIRL